MESELDELEEEIESDTEFLDHLLRNRRRTFGDFTRIIDKVIHHNYI